MKTKLHIGILAVLLAFLGTFIDYSTVPNQQIVIEFSDQSVSTEETENAIETIQAKLNRIGVTQIHIGQNKEGQLRITYYSKDNVDYIQNLLFTAEDFPIAYKTTQEHPNRFPDDNTKKEYELNISEIKVSSNIDWSFEGTQVTEINHKTDQSNPLKIQYSAGTVNSDQAYGKIQVAISLKNSVAIAKDHLSYKIPEVRAGPLVGDCFIL